jgi:dephospho-CoA kinase
VPPALIVGLTGGIASGKSTVAQLFRSLGVPVVDADEAARKAVAPGSEGLAAVRERFGDSVLAQDGTLDRVRMRRLVFANPSARRALEAIVHPEVRRIMDAQLISADAPYAISMIPLLLETGQERRVDRVLVVDLPAEAQVARATARDSSSSPETLEGVLRAQVDRETRLRRADDVIHNDGPPEALRPQVEALHRRYLELAARLRATPNG